MREFDSVNYNSRPRGLTNVTGTLFFTADIPSRGRELWKSDGTSAGTLIVRDLVGGAASYAPAYLTAVNSTLYFVGNTSNGAELLG